MQLPHLPVIKDTDHAVALAEQHQDIFYLAAFKIQLWLGDLLLEDINEYANHPDPATRSMQTGQAWRAFQPVFGAVRDQDFHQVLNCLARFAESENPVSQQLRRAMHAVYLEHQVYGEFLGLEALGPSPRSYPSARLMHRFVERVCDWVDAVVQINAHALWVHEPACFDPDPEKRRLASDQLIQPSMAEMNEPALVLPYIQPRAAGRRFRSGSPACSPAPSSTTPPSEAPGPGLPHSALCAPHSEERPFPRLDELIMTLWPVLKLHNWTYADFWNILSQGDIPLAPTPCSDRRHLAHYCLHTLGLRKTGHGQTTRNALPPGHELVLVFLRPASRRRSPPLGRGPWS
ncbi:MAG TPA: hypothetical protein VN578_23065 [Candidatus Binatia bacterium]|jgi:hypothetical protein|nr:hypothetical protein [Candidatus Binatia bacterium]